MLQQLLVPLPLALTYRLPVTELRLRFPLELVDLLDWELVFVCDEVVCCTSCGCNLRPKF
jgi:hypothetical protein